MTRLSVRAWSAGSTRSAGPAQRVGAVVIQGNQLGRCGWCGVHTYCPGMGHGARVAFNAPPWWPECEHGRRFMVNCVGAPVPPSCCKVAWRAVLLLVGFSLWARAVRS